MGRPKKIKTQEYFPTKEDYKSMSWCLKNRIRCYPKVFGDEFKVIFEYVDNGKIKQLNLLSLMINTQLLGQCGGFIGINITATKSAHLDRFWYL